MHPLYAQCPHCGFPAVINVLESVVRRQCRQCRGEYTPGVPVREAMSPAARRTSAIDRLRAGLRVHLRQRLRFPR